MSGRGQILKFLDFGNPLLDLFVDGFGLGLFLGLSEL